MSTTYDRSAPRNSAHDEHSPGGRGWGAALPLLSFGAGAADAFAYMVLGGIFTANMTGNAVLASLYGPPDHVILLTGAVTAIGSFGLALILGFRISRRRLGDGSRRALLASAACHVVVVLLWWHGVGARSDVLGLIAASAAAMALQTVAAKRDGVPHGPATTYATGTFTDLIADVADGHAPWYSIRWLPLFALPAGAASAVALSHAWPEMTPVLPLLVTTVSVLLIPASPALTIDALPARRATKRKS